MHALKELLEQQGKLEGRDYSVHGESIVNLRLYSGDLADILLPAGWLVRTLSTVPDPEGDEQMDVVLVEIHPR